MKKYNKLNALIAEKVLGYKNVCEDLLQTDRDYRGHWEELLVFQPYEDYPNLLEPVPNYEEELGATMSAVDAILTDVSELSIAKNHDGVYTVVIADRANDEGWRETIVIKHDKLPLALCQAILKYKGIECDI